MKSKTCILSLAVLALCACGGNPSSSFNEVTEIQDDYQFKWISPTGIPTLAFYDQGDNANWMSTSSPADFIPQAFASNSYDGIVFDGTSGLTNITKNNRNYKLARFISTGASFSVVSVKHTAEETFNPESTIDAFVKTGNAAQAFLSLAKNNWQWGDYYSSSLATFEDGVATVQSNLMTSLGQSHDYYVIAEPVKTAVTGNLKNKGVTLNTIYNLQTEWGKYHDGAYIPGGALFINNSSYAAHKDAIDAFLAKIDANVVDAIDDVDKVAAALNSYEEATEGEDSVKTRFGIPNANIYKAIQSGGKNGFGLYKDNDLAARKAIANSFAEAIGGTAFADSAFLS